MGRSVSVHVFWGYDLWNDDELSPLYDEDRGEEGDIEEALTAHFAKALGPQPDYETDSEGWGKWYSAASDAYKDGMAGASTIMYGVDGWGGWAIGYAKMHKRGFGPEPLKMDDIEGDTEKAEKLKDIMEALGLPRPTDEPQWLVSLTYF